MLSESSPQAAHLRVFTPCSEINRRDKDGQALINTSSGANVIAQYAQNFDTLRKTLITLTCNEIPRQTLTTQLALAATECICTI